MSGVLHPVGPEPASTYWLRRALVIGVLVVVVVVIVALASRGSGPRQSVPAVPAGTSSASVIAPPGDVSPTPSAAATGPTAKASPRSTPSTSPTLRPRTRKPTSTPSPTTSSTTDAKPSSKLCDPADLRLTLTGDQQLQAKTPVTFTLSLANSSATGCSVSVDAENFELTVSSGKDEIWSTSDCSTAVKSVVKTLASQQSVEWKTTWNGRRSVAGCKNGTQTLKPGTYVAKAQTESVKASLRMTLT